MNKFIKFLIFPLFILMFASFAYSKEYPKGVKLIKDGSSYIVEYSLPQYIMSEIKGGNETFTSLDIPEYGITSRVGQPKLPQISFFLLINKNESSPGLNILSRNKGTIELSSLIYPTQMPWEKSKSLDDRPFTIDRAYYNTKGSSEGPFVTISEPFVIAGAKGVMVTIYPFAYNPSSNKLEASVQGKFRINLQYSANLDFSPRPAMDGFFDVNFVNYEIKNAKGTNNYLIITAPDFESGLSPFVTHKQGLGYNVTVVNTGVTGTTNTAIKAYIQNLYNNISTRPEFVLMVGDIDKIPDFIGTGTGTPHTDWNYGLLEGGDMYVDAFVGRFPIQNLTQLGNIITKSIYMENGVNSLWKKNVFMASTDNHAISEGSHNFVIDSFFVPGGFTVNTKLWSYSGATTSQVSQSIDSGKIFAIYSGHGSETSWADGPSFSQSNVNALNNTIFPFVYSFACVTGSYHISGECFSETWIRSPKAGSVFWGSSVNSYWDEDDILERRISRAIFTENLKKNSENFVRGKILLVQYYGSITGMMQRYIEMYNCMGDPSIYQISYGPSIAHTPLPNTENLSGPYIINCAVSPSGSAITGTKLFWSRSSAFDSIPMTNTSGNNWSANITGNGNAANYKYFIRTQDAMNRTTFLPGGAPANYFSFTACPDTSKPAIIHTALSNVPKLSWPATVSAAVLDNIGIDSVWVSWYKNSISTGYKKFRLPNTGGLTYAAAFNSIGADVNIGDSIFYRVLARDNSMGHNADSTMLNKFKIINEANIIIGTGTTSSNFPFTTYWKDGRTQYLYLASEINAPSALIKQIGFDVTSVGGPEMTGYKVSFQNTTATTLTGFVNDNWTVAYNPASYAPTGTGWNMITMTTPFNYTGGNLLIDICYNNTTYTSYSTVNCTVAPNMYWGRYNDLTEPLGGCGYTAWTLTTGPVGRANTKLVLEPLTGVNPVGSQLPNVYSLSQNYPNPFNPTTKINFALPKQGFVSLKIYDVLGREVRSLVNEVKSAGSYTVDFNASEYSSGVYFYKLESNGFSDIKKMMLIK
ncbi:MAG: C25 family cysteine peptidase [Candidatus Kapaibacterium sp.]